MLPAQYYPDNAIAQIPQYNQKNIINVRQRDSQALSGSALSMPIRQQGLLKPTSKSKTNGRDKGLIIQLAILLDNNSEENNKVTTFLASYYNNDTSSKVETQANSLHVLATTIYKANIGDANKFTLSTQLNTKKPKTHKRAIYGTHG